MNRPSIAFAGTGTFAVPCLEALKKTTDIKLIISQPPKPSGKKRVLIKSPVCWMSEKLGLQIAIPRNIEDINDKISSLNLELLIVADYGQIIPNSTLKIPKYGCLNIHPSLLPRHRGPAPVVATILNGDCEAGITIIKMDEKMDHGPIVAQERCPLSGRETTSDLEAKLAQKASQLIVKYLPQFLAGNITLREQQHELATYHKLLKRSDGELRWTETAELIERKFRAYYPWPGIWLKKNIHGQEKIIKLLAVELLSGPVPVLAPGTFFWKDDILGITTIKEALKVNFLQIEGKKALTGEPFLRGYEDIIIRI
ncbi:methionyl-tRNA formyltransferase [Candidatus Uhrbacteria bacterium RIFCSPLOWO2_12_FULL_46_10]|uniref:Methionyl-tRNA formyltransferase n=1 Tax=Candidatus Uhrbacteria bacterium RIFCSPLOWO2_01_FULL_47_25 TaxID=1802402 RepID=A0A1F7UZ80_9BACT|nr:MAG: Methionyl-tRNA formyltransferase [Parcubacteria group bacterium GW2011_GWA2_46_9]OGL60709.1 MAG: methionyl-tRNA formyltransferase [Candidatus Uhrbacteria bacterium RIFCSPHIGHO2_01_FULL_46_23]OGL70340.1 MAG: methionyl-tRNA formyltransferase [Candidatus Uhrbacteria bacterium RIFCSPHIGHO2_02_FULL_47_29]OGL83027.1 MAG: methionyl-tRNA formyltransferase [Candidatus Uhrbacteria bacterium RIFCSPLOWO2_01_FULL_47_25]OGL84473.1 MAG: methionyl-tRNA formyltransferase [Candidatus Uhrbacteria bacteriu